MRAFFHGLSEFLKNTMMFLLAFSVGFLGCILLFILIPIILSVFLCLFFPVIAVSAFAMMLWNEIVFLAHMVDDKLDLRHRIGLN